MNEPAKHASQKTLRHAYDEAAVGLCYFDRDLRYMHINRWLAQLNGLPVEKHLGRTVHEVIPDVAAAGIEAELRQVMETKTPIIEGMVDAETRAGPGVRTFMHNYHPVVADSGQVIGVSCLVQDVTARRQAEVRLKARTAELEQANRDLQLALDSIETLEGLRGFSGRLITAQEAERRKIGRELHDDLSQRMALLSIQLDLLARDHPELADDVAQPQSTAREVATRIHEIAHELHPSRLKTLGLVSTLGLLCRDLIGFEVSYKVNRMPEQIPDDVSLCVYRVAQEALRNAMRHSGADGAAVALDGVPGGVRLTVRDEGCGILQANTGGLGLVSMRERARLIEGTLSIRSAPDQGTQVTLELPYGEETRPA